MIILNLDLGEDIEKLFYNKISKEKISYLRYVEELIINDLKKHNLNDEPEEELEVIEEDKKQSDNSALGRLC